MAPADHTPLASAMANGLDRLEKLFLKKKMSSSSAKARASPENSRCTTPSLTSPSHFDLDKSVFPQATFVRPNKSTRMVARNEVCDTVRSAKKGRTPKFPRSSAPGSVTPPERLSFGDAQDTSSGNVGSATQNPTTSDIQIRAKPSKLISSGDAHDINNMSLQSSIQSPISLEPSGSITSLKRFSYGDTQDTSTSSLPSSLSSVSSPRVPRRSSSLLARRQDATLAGMVPLVPLQLAKPARRSRNSSLSSAAPDPCRRAQPQPTSKALLEAAPIYPTPRVETPPPSDQDDNHSPTSPCFKMKLSQSQAATWNLFQPTPGPSPEMSPIRDSSFEEPRTDDNFNTKTRARSVLAPQLPPREAILRKVLSDPCLVSPPGGKRSDRTLEEVRWGDFLALSDDDIAERQLAPFSPPPAKLPPPPPVPPPSARRSTLMSAAGDHIIPSSPLSKRPAAVAAFEAARIAKKYDLDLLYIVNLWPVGMTRQRDLPHIKSTRANSDAAIYPTSPASAASAPALDQSSSTPRSSVYSLSDLGSCLENDAAAAPCFSKRTGMTGRILAAFGLAEVRSPFRLSGAVHKKILRTGGWVEYLQADPKSDEFARGYACAFHAGHSLDGRRFSAPDTKILAPPRPQTPTSPRGRTTERKLSSEKSLNNRGIVFAAYRKPRADGGSITSSPAELAALHDDAEGLVELLIDFHVAQRHRQRVKEARRRNRSSGAAISVATSAESSTD